MVHVDSTFVVQQAGYYVAKVVNHDEESVWSNTLAIPLYAAVLSFIFLVFHGILTSKPLKKLFGWSSDPLPEVKGFRARIAAHGGPVIFLSEVLRVIGCAALVGLSVTTWVLEGPVVLLGFVSIVLVSTSYINTSISIPPDS